MIDNYHTPPQPAQLNIKPIALVVQRQTSLVCLSLNEAGNVSHGKRCLQGSVKTTLTDCSRLTNSQNGRVIAFSGLLMVHHTAGKSAVQNPMITVHLARLQCCLVMEVQ